MGVEETQTEGGERKIIDEVNVPLVKICKECQHNGISFKKDEVLFQLCMTHDDVQVRYDIASFTKMFNCQ